MNSMRNRLGVLFLAATVPPLLLTLWVTHSLFERSLEYASLSELDQVSRSLELATRRIYQNERDQLRAEADSGRAKPEAFPVSARRLWPSEVEDFWESGQTERPLLDQKQDRIYLLRRNRSEVLRYVRPMGGIRLNQIQAQHAKARKLVEQSQRLDLRTGFFYTLLLLASIPWALSLAALLYFAHRLSRPIHQLTAALGRVAAGDLTVRLPEGRRDEVGAAMSAFNRMTGEMLSNRERLLYLTRLESWQRLARKTAHEIKNSLTPIRLTMEELASRQSDGGAFQKQAAQIVVDEVNSLERRVRAFSDLAAEPPVHLESLDAAALLRERILLLSSSHPGVDFQLRLHPEPAPVLADEDLLRAVVTNLLVNASEAAGQHGAVLVSTNPSPGKVAIEVHDSGPGLTAQALSTLFEPTVSFKRGGMGLGLSIARKSALLCGGDIVLVKGELGGAGFRVLLPASCP